MSTLTNYRFEAVRSGWDKLCENIYRKILRS
jgi:hypothetical protein